jgi:hypothetical protein
MPPIEFPLVVQVPSVVIPQEWNYLMSTEPDPLSRRAIEWGTPEPFRFDPRIINPAWR